MLFNGCGRRKDEDGNDDDCGDDEEEEDNDDDGNNNEEEDNEDDNDEEGDNAVVSVCVSGGSGIVCEFATADGDEEGKEEGKEEDNDFDNCNDCDDNCGDNDCDVEIDALVVSDAGICCVCADGVVLFLLRLRFVPPCVSSLFVSVDDPPFGFIPFCKFCVSAEELLLLLLLALLLLLLDPDLAFCLSFCFLFCVFDLLLLLLLLCSCVSSLEESSLDDASSAGVDEISSNLLLSSVLCV